MDHLTIKSHYRSKNGSELENSINKTNGINKTKCLIITNAAIKLATTTLAVTLFLISFQVNTALASKSDKIIQNVKNYIQNIRSVAIEFKQHDTKGTISEGVLIIDKPHKFRVNYFAPFPLLIIGNKNYVSVYDYEMETISRIAAKENIFNFLLVDQIKFDNQFEILESQETATDYKIKILHLESLRTSEIVFNKKTQNITRMKIIEDDNVINLEFSDTQNIKKINGKLFILQDPDIFGKPTRLDKKALEKNFN